MQGLSSLERKLIILQQDEALLQPREPDIYVDFSNYTLSFKIPDSDTGKLITKAYSPYPTTLSFHRDNSFVRLIMGPFGSGKSSACLAECIFHASNMPFSLNGKRYAKVTLVRETYGMLESTTLASWHMWFDALGRTHETKKPPHIHLKYRDQWGEVELELVFLSLDRPDHLSKLFSNEFSLAYFNEMKFTLEEAIDIMGGRVGRYPQQDSLNTPDKWSFILFNCPDDPLFLATLHHYAKRMFFKRIIGDTNPPDEDHYIYRRFEMEKVDGYRIFKQPPGLIQDKQGRWLENPGRENKRGLDADYYSRQAIGKPKEWIKVYCLGHYGLMKDGMLVHPSFNSDMHVVEELIPNIKLPLYLGWDFGLTPACTFEQIDSNGCMYTLHEVTSFDMDLIQMIENLVLPLLKTKFKGFKIAKSYHDPAGNQRMQTDGSTCHDILKQYNFNPEPAYTNDLPVRIRAANKPLDRMIAGKPAYYLDGTNCPMLKKAFLKEYKYRRMLVGGSDPKYADKPEKNKFSHVIEAHHYFCVGMDEPILREEFNTTSPGFIGYNQHTWGL